MRRAGRTSERAVSCPVDATSSESSRSKFGSTCRFVHVAFRSNDRAETSVCEGTQPAEPQGMWRPATLVWLLFVVACGSDTTPGGDDTPPPPGSGPWFYADVAPILARQCVGCHQPG